VDEDTFFHSTGERWHGGQQRPGADARQIMQARYPSGGLEHLRCQASDGDNFTNDSGNCRRLLEEKILPLVRYFAYVQVAAGRAKPVAGIHPARPKRLRRTLPCARCPSPDQIYPVFRDLFKKEGVRHEPGRFTPPWERRRRQTICGA
jgi:uncharacterized sporulation protein YeaH/YhbH (DUF444 family)